MFTGIIESLGTVAEVIAGDDLHRLVVTSPVVTDGVTVGDSISVNGVCLTVVEAVDDRMTAEVVPETLRRTNLDNLKAGDDINVERSMVVGGRFGGHIVQGHIDQQCTLIKRTPDGASDLLTFGLGAELAGYVVEKGFVALDGVSLTVVDVTTDVFHVALIPHTMACVTLGKAPRGYRANLEVDVLGRYVQRIMGNKTETTSVSWSELRAAGFVSEEADE